MLLLVVVLAAACGSGGHTSSATSTSTTTIASTTSTSVAGATGGTSSTAAPATTIPTPRPPEGAGVFGVVTAGPTCPVERADQPCPPRPVAAARIDALDGGGRNVAHATSDKNGNYALALAPGTYTLSTSTGSAFPRCSTRMATVVAGGHTRADITCDTGIR